MEAVVTSPVLISVIARSTASTLIQQFTEDEDAVADVSSKMRQLLSHLHQRHPKAVEAASALIIEEDDSKTDAVEQLILSLSVVS